MERLSPFLQAPPEAVMPLILRSSVAITRESCLCFAFPDSLKKVIKGPIKSFKCNLLGLSIESPVLGTFRSKLSQILGLHIVGGGAIICPGVTIGSRSVIGAGSVVTRDIPDEVLAVGNPCRVVREIVESDAHMT